MPAGQQLIVSPHRSVRACSPNDEPRAARPRQAPPGCRGLLLAGGTREQGHEHHWRDYPIGRIRRHALIRQGAQRRAAKVHAGLDRWDGLHDDPSNRLRHGRCLAYSAVTQIRPLRASKPATGGRNRPPSHRQHSRCASSRFPLGSRSSATGDLGRGSWHRADRTHRLAPKIAYSARFKMTTAVPPPVAGVGLMYFISSPVIVMERF